MFAVSKVTEAAFPELIVAGGVAGLNLFTRALDAKAGRVVALRKWNTWALLGTGFGSCLAIGYGTFPTLATAALIACAVPVSDRLLTPLIESAVGVAVLPAGPVPAALLSPQPRNPSLAESRALAESQARKSKAGYQWREPTRVPYLI